MTIYNQYNPTLGGEDYPSQIEQFISSVGTDVKALQDAGAATKIIGGTTDNLITQTIDGNIQDSGVAITDNAVKTGAFTTNNLLAIDASGLIIDAGRPKIDPVNTYVSGGQTITLGALIPLLAHNLSVVPITSIYIKCIVDDLPYTIGDEVLIMDSQAVTILVDDTYYNIQYSDVNTITIPDITDGSPFIITVANWELIIRGIK